MIEHVEHHTGSRGQRAEFRLESDQAAGRNQVVEPDAALAVELHVLQLAAPLAEALHDRALVFGLQVHDQHLVGRVDAGGQGDLVPALRVGDHRRQRRVSGRQL